MKNFSSLRIGIVSMLLLVSALQLRAGTPEQNSTSTTTMKDHVCTSACMNGQHAYAHGEKGHVCGTACAAMMKNANAKPASKMAMKEHVCTTACTDGKHMYAHGEKGHVCSAACKPKM